MAVQVAQNSFEHHIMWIFSRKGWTWMLIVLPPKIAAPCVLFQGRKHQVQPGTAAAGQKNAKRFRQGIPCATDKSWCIYSFWYMLILLRSHWHPVPIIEPELIWSESRSQGDRCPYILCLDSHVTFNSSFTVCSLFSLNLQPVRTRLCGSFMQNKTHM